MMSTNTGSTGRGRTRPSTTAVVDDQGGHHVQAHCFVEAVEWVRHYRNSQRRSPFIKLDVYPELMPADDLTTYRRFVELLEASRTVATFWVHGEWTGWPEDDMERLFGDVLPNHPTLDRLYFDVGQLPIRFFRMLTEKLPSAAEDSSLEELELRQWSVDPAICAQVVQAIANMLERGAAVAGLDFVVIRLTADQCKLICQAVPRNTHLQRLILHTVDEMRADTLVGVAASSSLRQLRVVARSIAVDAIPALARQLRTNESITDLCLLELSMSAHQASIEAMLDLVKTYNYTLESVSGIATWYRTDHYQEQLEQLKDYLRHNERIRNVLQQLRTSKSDSKSNSKKNASSRQVVVLPRKRLPILLDRVSDVPTAMFRILKMGYGVEVSACIMARLNSPGPCIGLRRSVRLRRRRCRSNDD